MNLFALNASLRKESLNGKLLHLLAEHLRSAGHQVDLAGLAEFPLPHYDGDLEAASGSPALAQALAERFAKADAFLIASPEYNFSFPGTLKNAIDWLSRLKPVPFRGKPGLLLSASPGLVGGNRGLWALRVPLEALGANLSPDMFSLASAHAAFDQQGGLTDAGLAKRLNDSAANFARFAEALKKA